MIKKYKKINEKVVQNYRKFESIKQMAMHYEVKPYICRLALLEKNIDWKTYYKEKYKNKIREQNINKLIKFLNLIKTEFSILRFQSKLLNFYYLVKPQVISKSTKISVQLPIYRITWNFYDELIIRKIDVISRISDSNNVMRYYINILGKKIYLSKFVSSEGKVMYDLHGRIPKFEILSREEFLEEICK